MHVDIAPSYDLESLSAPALDGLDRVPIFSIEHPPIEGLGEADDYKDVARAFHQGVAKRIGLDTHIEDYTFRGKGVDWHADATPITKADEGSAHRYVDSFMIYTTITEASMVYAARILDEGENLPGLYQCSDVMKILRGAKHLQQSRSIGSVARASSCPSTTLVWRENLEASRDTAHSVWSPIAGRLTFGSSWR